MSKATGWSKSETENLPVDEFWEAFDTVADLHRRAAAEVG